MMLELKDHQSTMFTLNSQKKKNAYYIFGNWRQIEFKEIKLAKRKDTIEHNLYRNLK